MKNGLSLSAGDEVVLWAQNNPTNNVAWVIRAARFGIVVKRVSTPASPRNSSELVDAFARVLTPGCRVLTITQVSNVSGIRAREAAVRTCTKYRLHLKVAFL